MVDEQQGPTTKREYDIAKVPAGDSLMGKVVDFLGRPPDSQIQQGTNVFVPLFGEQADMESREQIAQPLVTGVKVCNASAVKLEATFAENFVLPHGDLQNVDTCLIRTHAMLYAV